MDSRGLEICVLPVALQPHGPTQLRVVTYRPNRQWLHAALDPAESPADAARHLLSRVPHVEELSAEWTPRLEKVGFVQADAAVRLIFTAALPSTVTMVDTQDASGPEKGWVLLAPWVEGAQRRVSSKAADQALLEPDEIHRLALNYWRHYVEETTAAFDLLPRYFTTRQVRAVYSSIWGTRQDAGNFYRWLHTFNKGVCREVAPHEVRQQVNESVQKRWQQTTLGEGGLSVALASAAKFVGASPMAFGALAALGGAAVVGAAVGGLIAYQGALARGTDPKWYSRTDADRRFLKELYSPRPGWLTPGPAA